MITLPLFLYQIVQTPSNLENELVALPRSGNPFQLQNLMAFLSNVLGWAIIIGGLIIFFCILFSGIQWMLAGGDKSAVQTARSRITSCLIGFTVLALTYAVALIVQYFFGISILQTPGGTYIAYTPPANIPGYNRPTLVPATTGGGPVGGNGPVPPTNTPVPPTPTPTLALPTTAPQGNGRIRYTFNSEAQAPDYIVPDSSGNNFNGTLQDPQGDDFIANRGCNGAYRFDGQNGAIKGGENTNDPQFSDAKNYAVAAWIYPEQPGSVPFADILIDIDSTIVLEFNRSRQLRAKHMHPTNGAYYQLMSNRSEDLIPMNQWSHIGLVYNEADQTLRLFLNGNEIATNTNVLPPSELHTVGQCPVAIGTNCYGQGSSTDFGGFIDEVAIYTHNDATTQPVFSAETIRSEYRACNPN